METPTKVYGFTLKEEDEIVLEKLLQYFQQNKDFNLYYPRAGKSLIARFFKVSQLEKEF